MKTNKSRYFICIIAGGLLWGTMGLFRRTMGDMGLESTQIVAVRCGFAAVLFAVAIAVSNPAAFKVKLKDAWCFAGSGIISLLFFSTCYFQAMNYMSLSAAAILLYTAPPFALIISAVVFGEKITKRKALAVALAFAGCCLVSGIMGGGLGIGGKGLLFGLGAGLGYGLYAIFGKLALNRGYSSLTVNFYSCLLACAGACILGKSAGTLQTVFINTQNLLLCLTAGLVTCFLPYLLYTFGLTGVEAGMAAVIASVEPVMATVLGIAVYREIPDAFGIAGMLLVLAAIALANSAGREKTG